MKDDDTIVSIASGIGGAIGIIRMSGSRALETASGVFRKLKKNQENLNEKCDNKKETGVEENNNFKVRVLEKQEDYFIKAKSHTIHYGCIVDDDENILDEVIVLVMKAPNTYTREDSIEIDTHGGSLVMKKIVRLLIEHGARAAEPGEFTKRAFLNGRIDLSQAESVMDIISSKSSLALKNSVDHLEGHLSVFIKNIRTTILDDLSFIEAGLDDPEHIDIEGYSKVLLSHTDDEIRRIDRLLSDYDNGKVLYQGINTVICGRPNAGKSSILNLMLDEDRAIVTEIPGTTRDVVKDSVRFGNIILNLADTAGIHKTDDKIENIGVEKSLEYVKNADLILYIVDSTKPFDKDDRKIIDIIKNKKGILVFNKCDVNDNPDDVFSKETGWDDIHFSAKTGQGFDELKQKITDMFYNDDVAVNDEVHITSERHYNALMNARNSLKNVRRTITDSMPEDLYCVDLEDAYNYLGLINGDTATEDLVDNIFKKFCMGK